MGVAEAKPIVREKLKKTTYRGYSIEKIKALPWETLLSILPATRRRRLKKGLTPQEKKILLKCKKIEEKGKKGETPIRTHVRNTIILPDHLGHKFQVHNGKEFLEMDADLNKLGSHLGWFSPTRKPVNHGKGDSAKKGK